MRGQHSRGQQEAAKMKGWDPTEMIGPMSYGNMDNVPLEAAPADVNGKTTVQNLGPAPTPHNEGKGPKRSDPFPGIPM